MFIIKVKTDQFKTQCKDNISHAFETAKITLFDPVVCNTTDAPSCCAEHLYSKFYWLPLFYANFYATVYESLLAIFESVFPSTQVLMVDCFTVGWLMLVG